MNAQIYLRLAYALALGSCLFTGTGEVAALDNPRAKVQAFPKVTLTLGRPTGQALPALEHTPLSIPFTLVVDPNDKGAKPTTDLVVCQKDTDNCVSFPQVTPSWRSASGTAVRTEAPAAGRGRTIRLVACTAAVSSEQVRTCGTELTSAAVAFDVKMRIDVVMENFRVSHTRAHTTDTTFVALAASFTDLENPANSQMRPVPPRCPEQSIPPGKTLCVGPSFVGDVRDGTHDVSNIRVGTFEMVPGAEKYITFVYLTLNYGTPPEPLNPPRRDMRGVAMQRAVQKLSAPGIAFSADFTSEINDLDGWRGCDGPTAAGVRRIFNFKGQAQTESTVDELTRDAGHHSTTSNEFSVPSQTGCGDSPKYQVSWTVKRTSWKPS